MSSQERELVAGLRAEIAALEPNRACDRRALVAGLGTTLVRGDRPALARLMVRLSRDGAAGGAPGGSASHGAGATGTSHGAGGHRSGTATALLPFDWASAPEHCRIAFLRGRFLARGSLSLTGGRLHLEFVVPVDEAPVLAAQLAVFGSVPGIRVRRGAGVVTWKGSEAIGTFLRWIGAGASWLEIESRQVMRSVRGDLNRIINAESANLERIASAAARQLGAIATLESDGRLAAQPPVVREVARARVTTPEASLTQLSEELALPRGRVQRALERLEALALHDPTADD